MFKKHMLVLAVVALSSGAAFADNEAEISQDGTTDSSLATIEQNSLSDSQGTLNGNYGQSIQSATIGSSSQIFQGSDPASNTSLLDVSGGAPTSQSILAQTVTLPVDPLGYASQISAAGNSANSVAVVAQFNTTNATASIMQLSGAEDLTFASGITYLPGVVDTAGTASGSLTTSATAAGTTLSWGTSGASTYTDTFLGQTLTIGAGTGGGLNDGNIAVVDQGDTPNDRSGNPLDGGANTWGAGGLASYDDVAQIVQSGENQTAVIVQAGDAQLASIYQDGLQNDAYIVQFGQPGVAQGAADTTADGAANFAAIVQLATADVATIEQGGTSNTAYILQH